MKKLIASAGLAAVSATGLQAAYAPNLTPMETSKPWSVSAAVRGFYDDNYTTQIKDLKDESFGVEFSPSVAINLPLDQTYIGASYVYSMRYYEAREDNNIDHSHEFNLKFNHKFSERYKLDVVDSFAYSREPEVVQPIGGGFSQVLRTDADVLRNLVRADFTAQLTELISIVPAYQLIWYDYQDEGVGSRSAFLDRLEHLLQLDGRYQIQEHLVGLAGYSFGVFDYTSKEVIDPVSGLTGDARDSQSHYFYVGAEYAVSSQLNAIAKAGVQYTTYDTGGDDELSPYFDLNATYTYLQNSYAQLGIRHTRNATDVLAQDQESTLVYASLNHRISREVTASVLGQYQYGVFNGGVFDDDIEHFLLLGLNLEYRFNPNWAVEAGYNWDRLDSDLGRSYSRNRVYVGASATY